MIVVAQHKNQYYGRNKAHGHGRLGSSCRTFESGTGLFQTQSKFCKKPAIKRAFSGSLSPKGASFSPSPPVNSVMSKSEDHKKCRKPARSSSIVVPFNIELDVGSRNDEFEFSELWAGPAYSNSPPPSSLPMPKFSLRPKRSVSLELPASMSDIDLRPMAKSAPTSPTREQSRSLGSLFYNTDSATQTLRRILNLEITEG